MADKSEFSNLKGFNKAEKASVYFQDLFKF